MTKEQLELIAALIAGQQAAIVHLSMQVAQQTGIKKEDMAESFRRTAELLSNEVQNKKIITMVLNQIASGIDTSSPEGENDVSEQIKNLLH